MDREKVIKGLECCISGNPAICKRVGCSYAEEHDGIGDVCIDHLMADALALLKAQEPVEPIYTAVHNVDWKNLSHWNCGACNAFLYADAWFGDTLKDDRPKYCQCCGRQVKWNDSN